MTSINIKAIGVGGAGCNSIQQLAGDTDLCKHFTVVDTDAQSLERVVVPEKIRIGHSVTRGLSTGGNLALGTKITNADKDVLKPLLQDLDLLILAVGLGGGTGTPLAPALARWARDYGALVVVFAYLPFSLEGRSRRQVAEEGLGQLRLTADAVIPLPNDLLLQHLSVQATVLEAFAEGNVWASCAVHALLRSILTPGIINVDFQNMKHIFHSSGGKTLFSFGSAEGEGYIEKVLDELLYCPLLHTPQAMQQADSLLVNISGGADLTLKAVNHIGNTLAQHFNSQENLLLGAVIDEDKEQSIDICVIGKTTLQRSNSRVGRRKRRSSKDNPNQQVLFDDAWISGGHHEFGSKENTPPQDERGYFYETDQNLHEGNDLDIPTYLRRGIKIEL